MYDLHKRIEFLCKENKTNITIMCKEAGIGRSTLTELKQGRTKGLSQTNIKKIAEHFNVTTDYLLGKTGNPNEYRHLPKGVKIPVLGSIPAGIPTEAIEDIIDYEEVPTEWVSGGAEYFGLKIKGDSMYPEYRNGDVIIFRKQSTCDNNDDCAVLVNGYDATFKRVERLTSGIVLKPLNPSYDTKFYTNEEIENLPVIILGVFWELRRSRKTKATPTANRFIKNDEQSYIHGKAAAFGGAKKNVVLTKEEDLIALKALKAIEEEDDM